MVKIETAGLSTTVVVPAVYSLAASRVNLEAVILHPNSITLCLGLGDIFADYYSQKIAIVNRLQQCPITNI